MPNDAILQGLRVLKGRNPTECQHRFDIFDGVNYYDILPVESSLSR